LQIPFSEVIPFKRFVLLSKILHFADNENLPENDHLRKLGPVLKHLNETKFQRSILSPGECGN
jgi:hypothetical protein